MHMLIYSILKNTFSFGCQDFSIHPNNSFLPYVKLLCNFWTVIFKEVLKKLQIKLKLGCGGIQRLEAMWKDQVDTDWLHWCLLLHLSPDSIIVSSGIKRIWTEIQLMSPIYYVTLGKFFLSLSSTVSYIKTWTTVMTMSTEAIIHWDLVNSGH